MKVAENERDLDDDDEWTNECLFDIVEYDFPVLDSNDIFARQRHIEKMRQREVASIRLLDGDAAIDHRETSFMTQTNCPTNWSSFRSLVVGHDASRKVASETWLADGPSADGAFRY